MDHSFPQNKIEFVSGSNTQPTTRRNMAQHHAYTQQFTPIRYGTNDVFEHIQTVKTAIGSCAESLATTNGKIEAEKNRGAQRDAAIKQITAELSGVSTNMTLFSDQLREMLATRAQNKLTANVVAEICDIKVKDAVTHCEREDARHRSELDSDRESLAKCVADDFREIRDNIAQDEEDIKTIKKETLDLREQLSVVEERVDVVISREEASESAFDRLNDAVSNLSERIERVESDLSYAESDINGLKTGTKSALSYDRVINEKLGNIISLFNALERKYDNTHSYTIRINGGVLAHRTKLNGELILDVNL